MASMIPLPDLHLDISDNTCCSKGSRSSRIIYNEDRRKFEVRDVSILCCVCGAGDIVKDENSRTWDAFMNALQSHYGVNPKEESPDLHIDWQRLKRDRKKLTHGQFEHFVEWAERVQQERSQNDKTIRRVPSFNIHLDVRVRSDSGAVPFNPEILAGDLRRSPSRELLSESQIERIVELVVEELQTSGRREVSKSEIAEIVKKKISEI